LPGDYNEETDDGPGMQFTYDEMDRLDKIIDPNGNVIAKYLYDEDGRVIKEINAKGYSSADNDEERWAHCTNIILPAGLLKKGLPLKA